MRCRSCNVELTDAEAVRKYDNWEEITNGDVFIDLCNHCLSQSDLASPYDLDEHEMEDGNEVHSDGDL
jgi:hypothetical protein